MNLVAPRKSWLPLVRAVLQSGQDRSQCTQSQNEGAELQMVNLDSRPTLSLEDLGRDVKEESKAQAREECG